MVPLMLKRLRRLQNLKEIHNGTHSNFRPFAHLVNNLLEDENTKNETISDKEKLDDSILMSPPRLTSPLRPEQETPVRSDTSLNISDTDGGSARKKPRMDNSDSSITFPYQSPNPHKTNSITMCETSNSSWAELESYVIGSVQIFPPTHSTRQMLILR